MNGLDWWILIVTIGLIVWYGIYKSRRSNDIRSYWLADRQLPWYHVGLSVMATQASAITFLAAPGQAYGDGLRFVQFYFGLPLAMIVLCAFFLPIYRNLNVYTAYEYLEKRFDSKTRTLTATLFLLQRGLSTGITIYAPSIVLSTILHLDIRVTTIFTGLIVTLYTVSGGTKAVSYTQLLQMAVIFSGLFIAGWMVVHLLPHKVNFIDALSIAGKMGKLNAIDWKFDLNNRYNVWSGIIGGFFLQLSYFGTDQSQVGRYLTGKSTKQSRIGLVMNGMVKIPMQFMILLIGTLVFTFYQFQTPPLYFNHVEVDRIANASDKALYQSFENDYYANHTVKRGHVLELTDAIQHNDQQEIDRLRPIVQSDDQRGKEIRANAITIIQRNNPNADANDTNYVFLYFVTHNLPHGIIGLLITIVLLAAMGSTASGLNSLGSSTSVDFYRRFWGDDQSENQFISTSRWITAAWGIFCTVIAIYAGKIGNLIEAVNILGSLFYGTILGIFLTAFFLKKVTGKSVFVAAIITEIMVYIGWKNDWLAFLWLNAFGALTVMALSWLFQITMKSTLNHQRTSVT